MSGVIPAPPWGSDSRGGSAQGVWVIFSVPDLIAATVGMLALLSSPTLASTLSVTLSSTLCSRAQSGTSSFPV
jgi:hypothetical protein